MGTFGQNVGWVDQLREFLRKREVRHNRSEWLQPEGVDRDGCTRYTECSFGVGKRAFPHVDDESEVGKEINSEDGAMDFSDGENPGELPAETKIEVDEFLPICFDRGEIRRLECESSSRETVCSSTRRNDTDLCLGVDRKT